MALLAMQLTIVTVLRGGGQAGVMVSGDLDRSGVGFLCAQLAGLPRAGVFEPWLDLSGVRHHHPALADALAHEQAHLTRLGGRLIITSAPPALATELDTALGVEVTVPAQAGALSVVRGVAAAPHRGVPETADQP